MINIKKEEDHFHQSNGCDEETANIKAWDDYWKMANKRDGVEFFL